jgi:two-component system, NarL family, sensor histidine kinase UhpB
MAYSLAVNGCGKTALAVSRMSFKLDLKSALTLPLVAAALACFFVAAALALFATYRDVRDVNMRVADILVRRLQIQLSYIESGIDVTARFPDFDLVSEVLQTAGQCVQYVEADGSVVRSSCVGFNREVGKPPAWFVALGDWIPAAQVDVARPISYRGKPYGSVVVTTDRAAVLAAMWNDVSGLFSLTALVIGALCILQYAAISRALRPTRDILAALDRLAHGDLSSRLPNFRLIELQRISEAFNGLAANLERTTREKMQLAAKLVDHQEQERLDLARDLHDELAQSLTAMSALAASIKTTAETECPALVPDARSLSRTSMAVMKTLRTKLRALRPPELDDFGLAASLALLAADQEQLAGGRLKIALEINGDLRALPPTAASHLYRIVQEGLTNINKHAHAAQARIVLDVRPQAGKHAASDRRWLALTIEDDGHGAAEDGMTAEGDGLGLIGMRERVTALGGQLDIIDLGAKGFQLRATIPFESPIGLLP